MNDSKNDSNSDEKKSAPSRLRVFIADDHLLVREGIRLLIQKQPDMEVIGEAGDGETAWRQAKKLNPDVIVMDISMPLLNGAQATERLKNVRPDLKVLVLSAWQDEAHVRQLLQSGAKGYVLKKAAADELASAIRTVARGGMHLDPEIASKIVGGYINPIKADASTKLSSREEEILRLIAWGHTNKEIATQLHLSVKTIEGHKTRLMRKLNLDSRADIVRYALQRGWLNEE